MKSYMIFVEVVMLELSARLIPVNKVFGLIALI